MYLQSKRRQKVPSIGLNARLNGERHDRDESKAWVTMMQKMAETGQAQAVEIGVCTRDGKRSGSLAVRILRSIAADRLLFAFNFACKNGSLAPKYR